MSFSCTAAATIFRARSSAVMLGLSSSSSYSLSASSLPCPLLADALHATLVLGVPPAGLNTGLALDFGDEVTWDPFGAADFSADTGRSPSLASTRWMASSSEPGGRLYLSNRSSAVLAPTLRSGVVTPVIVPLFCSVVIQEGESVGAIAKGAGRRPDPFVWGIGVRDALSSLSCSPLSNATFDSVPSVGYRGPVAAALGVLPNWSAFPPTSTPGVRDFYHSTRIGGRWPFKLVPRQNSAPHPVKERATRVAFASQQPSASASFGARSRFSRGEARWR